MKVNRGSVLSKEYFLAYLTYVMRVFHCNADEAKVKTVGRLFCGDLSVYGEQTHQYFINAYKELTLAAPKVKNT
ncbi:hypothetical protein EDM59_21115 [Brevibacillus nitrificans]|uniref:Uncharacterized protein n=1 Tax=Brevibacillus nitrificans TaxID=651560 RepID=A0A3M8D246_9BACL|nr:hypothetical protein [Brevibacillus nitrificans]RNB82112.1 hypothetical protein EDM59_21115 [Brevibacillus nitrificans]